MMLGLGFGLTTVGAAASPSASALFTNYWSAQAGPSFVNSSGDDGVVSGASFDGSGLAFATAGDAVALPAASTPAGSFTLAVVAEFSVVPTGFMRLLSAESANAVGAGIRVTSAGAVQVLIGGSSSKTPTVGNVEAGVRRLYAGSFDSATGDWLVWASDGSASVVDASGVGSPVFTQPKVGQNAWNAGSQLLGCSVIAAAISEEALGAAPLQALADELGCS